MDIVACDSVAFSGVATACASPPEASGESVSAADMSDKLRRSPADAAKIDAKLSATYGQSVSVIAPHADAKRRASSSPSVRVAR